MKITFFVTSIDNNSGGPARSITSLIEALGEKKELTEITLTTFKSQNPIKTFFFNQKLHIKFYSPSFLQYSLRLNNDLKINETDLFHLNGIWNFQIHQVVKISRERKIPYLVSTRGMLEPWALNQKIIKKKIAMFIYQYKDIELANCIHSTSLLEMEGLRKLGFKNSIAVIPNGINIKNFPEKKYVTGKKNKTILFLSRIHIKKGIELLINSWELLDEDLKENWCIKIAGNGDSKYLQKIINQVNEKGLSEKITYIGYKSNSEKIDCYHDADLFVLPSYSENFGNVIAEALCCGVPVITSKHTPWDILEHHYAGKCIELGLFPLKETLEEMMSKSDKEIQTMGKNGRKLIIENYSIESVAKKMILLYQWILKKKNKPDFIYD
jgi:glycosyltransferase involved in cell wall biosynthesis